MSLSPDLYHRAMKFAAHAHRAQRLPGSELPYVVHTASVALEVLNAVPHDGLDAALAVPCALLHDTLEDTDTPEAALAAAFGDAVVRGVRALSKDPRLPKAEQMADSLARIGQEPREIAAVKLADRINNLQGPPVYWTREKRIAYREEARTIHRALAAAAPFLGQRLMAQIERYGDYIDGPDAVYKIKS